MTIAQTKRARLSRQESQEKTRERIVLTAKRLFSKQGYAGTSLEQVAEAAGYSKGAVYSNFRNKDELCLGVLEAYREKEIGAVARAFTEPATLEGRVAAFAAWAERMVGDAGWTLLEVEFALHSRGDPKLRASLRETQQAQCDAIAMLIELQSEQFGLEPVLPAKSLAYALLSLGIGLGIQRSIEPSLPVGVLVEVLGVFFRVPKKNGRKRTE